MVFRERGGTVKTTEENGVRLEREEEFGGNQWKMGESIYRAK
jgi:hypothetical protein